jgi:4a-hydroxytetrahydrobiopterin dehydratase
VDPGILRVATLPRNFEICIDTDDPAVLRPFWRSALGYVDEQTAEGAADLVDPAGVLPTVWFQKVPEVKWRKNRVHLDIRVRDQERERLVEALVALGGTVVATYPRFTTLADPEGNELCVTTQ